MTASIHCTETRHGCPAEQAGTRRGPAHAARRRGPRLVLRIAACLILLGGPVAAADEVRTLLERGRALERGGDSPGALAAYRAAVASAGDAPSRGRGEALLALAALESDLGTYADAATHAGEAVQLARSLGDAAGTAAALNQLGLAALYDGGYPRAAASFEEAAAVSASLGDEEGRAEQLTNLGNVHYFTGRYAEAGRRYAEALALAEGQAAAPWAARRRRLVLVNQATLQQRLGRDTEALAIYRDLGGAGGGLAPEERAQVLVNLGVLYRRLGDPVKALEAYGEAEALFARDRHVDGEIGVLKNRGIVLALDLGRLRDAEAVFTRALGMATASGDRREQLHARIYRGETRRRAGDTTAARDDFEAALPLARALDTPEEEWKALYGIGRTAEDRDAGAARLRDAVAVIEQIREGIRVPSLRSDFLTDKREVYDALIAAELPRGDAATLFGLVERSHSRVWRDRLGLPAFPDLSGVQRALPPGALLLDYWIGPTAGALIAVTHDAARVVPVRVAAGRVAALADHLAALPDTAAAGGHDHPGEPDGPAGLARELAAQLLPPPEWLEGVRHLIVVPDGPLALVPFEALPAGGELLVQRMAVSYTPTAATLLRAGAPARGLRAPWRLQLRAFGAPAFDAADLDDAAAARSGVGATAREVRSIAAELGGRAELHLGADNRKAALAAASAAPLLHLATHAAADASALEQSRLLFSAPGGTGRADYLFLREAYTLPLDGVDLVVLSACETARGRFVRGEGVQSFSRAFLAAGARSTVTTLWRVPDAPTAAFMALFYHHLQRGLPRDEALREAKRRFLADRTGLAHPHYWAAFVLTGDGTAPVPRAPRWASLGWALSVVLAMTVAAGWVRARNRRGRPHRVAAVANGAEGTSRTGPRP